MSYDKSKETTFKDVEKEAKDVVEAVKSHGDVKAEAKDVLDAAVDLVHDKFGGVVESAKTYFRVKLGYQLHDASQGVTITSEPTPAAETYWTKIQEDAGLIERVAAPATAAEVAPTQPTE